MANTKSLSEQIIEVYPELTSNNFQLGVIVLRNDSDGSGDYIAEWNYEKPLPESLKSYKR
jgi:hypothetical protein